MSIVCNCVSSSICFPRFVIFALIDNINATIHACTSADLFNRLSYYINSLNKPDSVCLMKNDITIQ